MLEELNKLASLLFKVIISVGVVVLFWYSSTDIHFFPTGLSLGDSLVFLFLALGFGVFYSFWIGIGYLSCLSLLYPWRYKGNTSFDKISAGVIFIAGVVLLFYLIYLSIRSDHPGTLVAPVASGILLSLATFLWNFNDQDKGEASNNEVDKNSITEDVQADPDNKSKIERHPQYRLVLVLVALLLPPFIGSPFIGHIVKASVRIIGLSNEHASLIVDDTNYRIIRNIAAELDIPIVGCNINSSDTNVVHNFGVLWHGIGERSLVEMLVPSKEDGGWEGKIKFELERSGLKIMDSTYENNMPSEMKACISVSGDTLFDRNVSSPNAVGQQQLNRLNQKLKSYLDDGGLEIKSIDIKGYTDRRRISNGQGSNYKLSTERASSVLNALKPLLEKVNPENIKSAGYGSINPKSNCSWELEGDQLDECLLVDRRVEIELYLSKSNKVASEEKSTSE